MPQYNSYDQVFVWDEVEGKVIRKAVTYGWYLAQMARGKNQRPVRFEVLGPWNKELSDAIWTEKLGKMEVIRRVEKLSIETAKTMAEVVMPEVLAAEPEGDGIFDGIGALVAELDNMVVRGEVNEDRVREIAKEHKMRPGNRKGEKLALYVMDNLKK